MTHPQPSTLSDEKSSVSMHTHMHAQTQMCVRCTRSHTYAGGRELGTRGFMEPYIDIFDKKTKKRHFLHTDSQHLHVCACKYKVCACKYKGVHASIKCVHASTECVHATRGCVHTHTCAGTTFMGAVLGKDIEDVIKQLRNSHTKCVKQSVDDLTARVTRGVGEVSRRMAQDQCRAAHLDLDRKDNSIEAFADDVRFAAVHAIRDVSVWVCTLCVGV